MLDLSDIHIDRLFALVEKATPIFEQLYQELQVARKRTDPAAAAPSKKQRTMLGTPRATCEQQASAAIVLTPGMMVYELLEGHRLYMIKMDPKFTYTEAFVDLAYYASMHGQVEIDTKVGLRTLKGFTKLRIIQKQTMCRMLEVRPRLSDVDFPATRNGDVMD